MWKMEVMNSENRKFRYQQSASVSAAAGTKKKKNDNHLTPLQGVRRKELTVPMRAEHGLLAHQIQQLWMKVSRAPCRLLAPNCLQNTAWERTQPGWVTTWASPGWQQRDTACCAPGWWGWGWAAINSSTLSHRSKNVRLPGLCCSYTSGC